MKPIHLYIETYKKAVSIYAGSRKQFIKALQKYHGKATAKEIKEICKDEPPYEGITFSVSGEVGTIIHITKPPTTPETIAVLIHEISHATNRILRDAGISLTAETEEAYTYLLEHLTREALKATPPHFAK